MSYLWCRGLGSTGVPRGTGSLQGGELVWPHVLPPSGQQGLVKQRDTKEEPMGVLGETVVTEKGFSFV